MLEPNIMTVANLRAYAQEHGINLGTAKKKADIVAAIEAAEEQASELEVVEAEIIEDETPNDLAVIYTAGTLQANFEQLNAYVDGILAEYEDWEPSANNIEDVKQCTAHRKYLNGLAKQLDEKRKFYKNEFLLPLNAFEANCNTVRDKIKAVSDRLNAVEKQADEARKDKKRESLREHYEAYAGLLVDIVPYERIEDPKWMNKQPTLEKAIVELEDKVNKVATDWETLKASNLDFAEQAEVVFFNTLDLGQAIAYAAKLKEDAAKIANMKAEIGTEEPPAPEPAPIQPMPQSNVSDFTAQIAETMSIYPPKLQAGFVDAIRLTQKPSNAASTPFVMLIDGATVDQCKAIGKFCGLIGVTGTFKQGTLAQVAQRTLSQPLAMGA